MEKKRAALPREYQDGILAITAMGGGLTTRVLPEQGHAFRFEVIFRTDHPRLREQAKPPMHFHLYQDEYVEVLEGSLVVEVEGVENVLRPGDGVLTLRRGVNHRTYPLDGGGSHRVRMLLSGEESSSAYKLELAFFENWYGYQEQLYMSGQRLDLIQALCMFDAAGSCLTLPAWLPFRSFASHLLGIVVGRWLGQLLGYRPFNEDLTTNQDRAWEKMETMTKGEDGMRKS
ncbi:hypothetical protein L249_0571 [Ophiocordyceps polyrhachis-furcata BCC 54312]|uniref:Cupin type-2 domain-containing protein n=1 Tax=Ophiocordyceps polyrhachis-furcata BCC 54312 TaxID=1330021 RepID=A0A367LD23_9HYPO|nr:hypothetical protein L249_0571 [Ophiocordyceps polyrhachis-furcata BCC 54312]